MVSKIITLNVFVVLYLCGTIALAETETNPIEVEGEIVKVSQLPDPKKADYPDCYYTALFKIENVLTPHQKISSEIVLVIPGFYKRTLVKEDQFHAGELLRAKIVLFDSLPEKARQIQQADQINSLDLDYYFYSQGSEIQSIDSIVNTSTQESTFHKNTFATVTTRLTAQDIKAQHERKKAIQKDIDSISQLLAKNGGDWKKWYDRLSPLRKKYDDCITANQSRWIGDSYFKASLYDDKWNHAENFKDAIIHLNQYLKQRNIDLIVVRVPNKGEIAGDLFVPGVQDSVLNPSLLKLNLELLKSDVEMVDVIPEAVKNRLKFPLMYWYQTKDNHPAEGMSWTVAEVLADRLKRYNFQARPENYLYLKKEEKEEDKDNYIFYNWPEGNPRFNPQQRATYDGVYVRSTHQPLQITEENNSPILIMGDSFITVPDYHFGGSIPHYLAYMTKVVPNWLFRWAGSPGMAVFLLHKGNDFLKGRKVCIFCFSPAVLFEEMTDLSGLIEKGHGILIQKIYGNEITHLSFSPPVNSSAVFKMENDMLRINMNPSRNEQMGLATLSLPPETQKYKKVMLSFIFQKSDSFALNIKYGDKNEKLYFHPNETVNSTHCVFEVIPNVNKVAIGFLTRNGNKPVFLKGIEIEGINE